VLVTAPSTVEEKTLVLGGAKLHYLEGGSGRPLVVLHGLEGPEGWLAFHESLSHSHRVIAPSQPGYGASERPDWLENIGHVAACFGWFLRESGLGPVDLVGAGVGGWIAAEMAVRCPASLAHLVLVDAAGLRPREAELLDVFLLPWREVNDRCFYDAAGCREYQRIYGESPIVDFGGVREAGRSTAMRTCYRPYMHDPALLPLLAAIRAPALVVWGAEDQIVPLECGHMYEQAIPGARLKVIEECGHRPHYERPEQLAALIEEFTS
jgi:pimeloyl-ACP methyl ester carboxylesterase